MDFIIFSLLAAMLGFVRPVWGLTVFLLANTGAAGFFESMGVLGGQLGWFRPENMGYICAVIALFLRKPDNTVSRRGISAIEILLWIITGMIFISRAAETGDPITIGKTAVYCLLWAPLFMGLQKLTPSERAQSRNLVIALSTLTAFLTILTVATGSQYLYQTLSIGRFHDLSQPAEFVTARVTLPGLWSLAYLGFWLSIREWLAQDKWSSRSSFWYGGAAVVMLIAFLLNLSRATLLGIATGFIVMAALSIFLLRGVQKKRVILLGIVVFSVLLFSYTSFTGLSDFVKERFTGILESYGVYQRLNTNEFYLRVLSNEIPLLGHKDDQRYAYLVLTGGDPHTFLRVWWDYGLIAGLSFFALVFAAFVNLARITVWHRRHSKQVLLTAICLMAFYLQFHWGMFAGYYLFPGPVFTLVFFLAEVTYLSQNESDRAKVVTSTGRLVTQERFV
jgi:hypothetical protein